MHFDILVEGYSDRAALEILLVGILCEKGQPHTWTLHHHGGLGKLPENLEATPTPKDSTLLHNLPAKLRAFGRDQDDDRVLVVLVDLDDRDCMEVKRELVALLDHCPEQPSVIFRIAIEELEAWYLGDRQALQAAYPNHLQEILADYVQDSQCNTSELLDRALNPDQYAPSKRSTPTRPKKVQWAQTICPAMDVENNQSPSFQAFRDALRLAAGRS